MSTHVRERMSAYIDRELPPSDRAGVESHLRECAECAREVDELRAVDDLARGSDVGAPAGYFDVLPGRLRARLSPPAAARVPAWALALAAGLAVAVIAPLALREARQPAPGASAPAADRLAVPRAEAPQTMDSAPPARPAPSPEGQTRERLAKRERADERAPGKVVMNAPGPGGALGSVTAVPPPEEKSAPPRMVEALAGRRAAAPPAMAPAAPAAAAAAEQVELRDEAAEEDPPLVSDSAGPEREAAGRPPAPPASRPGLARSRPGAEDEFRALSGRAAQSAVDARALREAWEAFVRREPDGPHADDARVRALEAGAAAWRLGGLRDDRERVMRDGRAYLRRPDAADKERVRALLAGLEP